MMCRIRIVSKVTVGAAHSVLIKVGCCERMGGGGGGRGGELRSRRTPRLEERERTISRVEERRRKIAVRARARACV